ncbi:two-component system sensor histidine kinase NtrB [Desulfofustis limnaeus]|jgi:two-component system sensor histidine kinase PilS (NtrC family)|uniref:histidine kinase n=1 Tax=Desulfofustis limnaeus TaxID=2740163 RepID=A0ABN6M6G8_9BACT|nr:ATP-binding protein [Desulfofustis limnaeus]MDX9896403.1 ATP-binding protein [Desulfofustis sp.]BDD87525.1 PAS domain-containing sensor histidine kinase [Desulfofustis limnaeus]
MNFLSYFKLERADDSYGELMKQQLMWMLLLRVVLYTLLLFISLLLMDERFDAITMPPSLLILFILGVYLVTVGAALLLFHSHGEFRRFGFVQTIVDAALASLLVYLTGASHSVFFSVYFFPIIAGGLLAPLKGGLLAAAASTMLYAGVLGLEYFGVLPDYLYFYDDFETHNLFGSVNHFSTKGLSFFLAAVISALFGARLKSTTEALSSTRQDFNRLTLLYKQIFDNISTGIITFDGNAIITSANNAAAAITGMSISAMTGRSLPAIFPDIDTDSRASRNVCDFERDDGQKLRIGYACTNVHRLDPAEQQPAPLPSEQQLYILSLKDIGEIERLEMQMRQSEKLAAIGMMSASIAHDFRNPLAAISGSAQVLAHEFASRQQDSGANYELTRIILRESDRLTKTIADFLKFARPESADREWFRLTTCLEDILQVCKADPKWPATARIDVEVDPLFRLWADEKQLFTALSHLINNALAFCPRGQEHLHIVAQQRMVADRGTMNGVSVYDNGPGIKDEDVKKIFEPFFTTRADGTGLGLAIVKQTIEAHNGFVVVGSSPLGGAGFSLYLPIPEGTRR